MKRPTRRDLCAIVGDRAAQLSDAQSSRAWRALAREVADLGERDIPKFRDLITAIRRAHIAAVQK
jgi:hypothetical protein